MKQQQLTGSLIPTKKRYWVTPPKLLRELEAEFGRLFDPCPNPRPPGFDGIKAKWESPAYCNPPFGAGTKPARWTKKCIAEAAQGKTVIYTIPCFLDRELARAHEVGAVLRPWGRVRWLDLLTGEENPRPGPFMFLAVWR